MAFLTDQAFAPYVNVNSLIHIVNTGDTSQNVAGSSYKATVQDVIGLVNPVDITGGTYNSTTGVVTLCNSSGACFDISGFTTGYTDVSVTAFTYNNANTFTIYETDGSTHSATINFMTGLTATTISATTYQNLPGSSISNCLTNFYATNIIGCSPIHIQPTNTGNVYISETGGNVGIGTTTIDGVAPETLAISATSLTSYNIISAKANVNNYTQFNLINKSTGTSSSADLVATNNTGNETTNFIDVGINGSNFTGTIGIGNDAYVYSTGRELYIGNATTGATSNIKFFAGNTTGTPGMVYSGSVGYLGIGTTTPTQRLDVSGKTRTTSLQITSGATNNYILLSDASGNASWSPQSSITGGTNTFVTGFTYNNANTITLSQNNGTSTGVTINIMTGLTVNGSISSQGLTATTISATTYQNLPTDIRTTGATYNNNTFTFTNNTGGTYSVNFNTVTGLTVNGNLTVTGNTSLSATTASTLTLSSVPTTDTSTNAQFLTRDSTTGLVKTKTSPGPTVYGLFSQTGNSGVVSATTVETTIIDGGVGSLSVPANGFSVGDSFRADFGGLLSAKNNDTLRIRIKTGSVVLGDSGAQTMTTTSNDVWQLSVNFTIRQTGGTGTASIVTLGVFHSVKQSNNTQTGFAFNTINNTTFDTTISNTLNVTAEWSSNSASNSIYSDIFVLNKIY